MAVVLGAEGVEGLAVIEVQERIGPALLAHRRRCRSCVMMTGKEGGIVRYLRLQTLQRLEYLFRIAAGQIAATAAINEQRIAGEQLTR